LISDCQFSFPIFDGHMHFSQAYLDEAMASYGECGVIGGVNLWGSASAQYNFVYHGDYAEFLKICRDKGLLFRFAQFYWPDWMEFGRDPKGFVSRVCDDLRRYAELGASGLKVWKDIGMFARMPDGTPATVDDERLEPVWQMVAELGLWISAHLADPDKSFESATTGVTKQQIYAARDRWLSSHKDIRCIICHSGNHATPEEFDRLLGSFPNLRVDLRDTLASGDRQTNCRLLEKYADRLYIGADMGMPENKPADRPWNIEYYRSWRRILAGLGLRPETLEKIAWRNGVGDFLGPTPAAV
jgi:hypothetical protein